MYSQYSIVILLVTSVNGENKGYSPETVKTNAYNCRRQAETPNFNKELVLGRSWRLYYSWNVELGEKCLDFVAKNATEAIVNRVWYDMNKYLEKKPDWDKAAMHTYLGPNRHEVLLIDTGKCPGSFIGVPYITGKDLSRLLNKGENNVPLFKFLYKLVHNDKYLLIMDCLVGIMSLFSRDRLPNWTEIMYVAHSLRLGEGMPACATYDNRSHEYLIEHNIT